MFKRSARLGVAQSLAELAFVFALTVGFSAPVSVWAAHADGGSANQPRSFLTQSQKIVTANELTRAVSAGLDRVAEFEYLKLQARDLGIRVWLFGGTAAGYAHYARWDHLRMEGDASYHPDRFDYQYLNIFRSTQDLDLAIDGNAEQAKELERRMREKFPHIQGTKGEKSVWEVRLLRETMGDKEAILSDDFQNQHTDSHSTGMIEVSDPLANEARIRDSRDFNNQTNSPFLEDVRKGELTYYFSDKHFTTSRAKKGLNPEIISVIRYYTKAFQYELKLKPQDLNHLKEIIKKFDPNAEIKKGNVGEVGYVLRWLEKNGPKILQHAVNLEYASNELDGLGLKEKLKTIGSVNEEGSLAWWMNKKPLPSFEVGKGPGRWTGKTAADLGITEVAHETKDFYAYESITKAHTGDPNVLESRGVDQHAGETAKHGDGFYTQRGKVGARGTGITIRFTVDPNAKEGIDFIQGPEGMVIFKNKKAFKVIPESLKFTWPQYVKFLANSKNFDPNDKAMVLKLRMGLSHEISRVSDEDFRVIKKIIHHEFKKGNPNIFLITEVLPIYEIRNQFHDMQNMIRKLLNRDDVYKNIMLLNQRDGYTGKSENILQELAVQFFSKPQTKSLKNELRLLIEKADQRTLYYLTEYTFSQPHTQEMGDLMRLVIQKGDKYVMRFLAEHVFSKPHTQDMQDNLKFLIEKAGTLNDGGRALVYLKEYVFSQPHTQGPEFMVLRESLEISDPTKRREFLEQKHQSSHAQGGSDLINCVTSRLR